MKLITVMGAEKQRTGSERLSDSGGSPTDTETKVLLCCQPHDFTADNIPLMSPAHHFR